METDKIRKERDALIEENKKLKALMNEDSAGPSSGNVKYLKNKVILIYLLFYLYISLDIPFREDSWLIGEGKVRVICEVYNGWRTTQEFIGAFDNVVAYILEKDSWYEENIKI